MNLREGSMGRTGFVQRFGLWSDAQHEAAMGVAALIREKNVASVRLCFVDQHGLLRGKTVIADEYALVMQSGCAITTTLLVKDTSHRSVYPVFTAGGGFGVPEMEGGGDAIMVPDPTTFRLLPWAPDTGWLLCDLYFKNGAPVPFSTRHVMRGALERLSALGYDYAAGLEVEFYVTKLVDPKLAPEHATWPPTPPAVEYLAHGFQYLTEIRMDEVDEVAQLLRRNILALGLPLRTIEMELGPSQFEMTFEPASGLEPADNMALFRNAVKQVCRRHGYHATFMCRPALPNCFSSGWHLHQSLWSRADGKNAFAPERDGEALSPLGRQFLAGLLDHARASSIFTTPTINGYKRYRPYSLAPDRVTWGADQRGAMVRAIGAGPGDPGTRLENRMGEPAANPYLYMTSQILAGLDGIARKLEPPDPSHTPYEAEATALPKTLMEAIAALRGSALYRQALGDRFVDYLITLKEAEVARFLAEVTDWEQREYFEIF